MQQFSILEYLNVDNGVDFWEIIKSGPDTVEKYLTNLLSFYYIVTRIFKKSLSKASKVGKQVSKASIKCARNGFHS